MGQLDLHIRSVNLAVRLTLKPVLSFAFALFPRLFANVVGRQCSCGLGGGATSSRLVRRILARVPPETPCISQAGSSIPETQSRDFHQGIVALTVALYHQSPVLAIFSYVIGNHFRCVISYTAPPHEWL